MRYPWAVPGRKVVCVNAENRPNARWNGDAPIVGAVYTIRRIFTGPDGNLQVDFDELRRSRSAIIYWNTKDVGYRLDRFRPLHTIETDAALFAGLLTPAPNAPMLPVNINMEPMGT